MGASSRKKLAKCAPLGYDKRSECRQCHRRGRRPPHRHRDATQTFFSAAGCRRDSLHDQWTIDNGQLKIPPLLVSSSHLSPTSSPLPLEFHLIIVNCPLSIFN